MTLQVRNKQTQTCLPFVPFYMHSHSCLLYSLIFMLLGFSPQATAQYEDPFGDQQQETLSVGKDIFNDLNEDLDSAQMMEDERFFRYGRFFTLQLSLGWTAFSGNRGQAYENNPPSYGFGVNYFSDFQTTFGVGFEFSKHHFLLDYEVNGYNDGDAGSSQGPGLVDVSMLRFYFSTRYYIDTSDLGTAITYSNPYFVARFEYWYTSNQFKDQEGIIPKDSGGAPGIGLGFGLEFPIKLKESYLGVEFLWHSVYFHDKYTQDYAPVPWGNGFGYDDLSGHVWSSMASYVINW